MILTTGWTCLITCFVIPYTIRLGYRGCSPPPLQRALYSKMTLLLKQSPELRHLCLSFCYKHAVFTFHDIRGCLCLLAPFNSRITQSATRTMNCVLINALWATLLQKGSKHVE